MLKPSIVFSLSLVAGAATAQSLPALPSASALSGLTSALTSTLASLGLPVGSLPGGLPSGFPALPGAPSDLSGGLPSQLPDGLPGLPGLPPAGSTSTGALPIGVTATQPGVDGSGQVQTLNLNQFTAIPNITNPLTAALTGAPSGTTPIAVGVDDGNHNANAAPGGLLALSAAGLNNTGNGGAIAVGLINDDNTGNGELVGVAALSGSGTSGTASNPNGLGVSLLNRGERLRISGGGQSVSINDVQQQVSALPSLDQGGIAIGGSTNSTTTSSNPVLNAGVLAGRNSGNGGLIGLALLSGSNSANHNQIAGISIAGADDSANNNGVAGVALISGNRSANDEGLAGVALISGDKSADPSPIGAGVLTGNDSGQGTILGAGVISGNNSGQGGALGVGALSGTNSGQGGVLGIGVANVQNPASGNTVAVAAPTSDKQCVIVTRDAQGKVIRTDKLQCKPGLGH